MKKTIKLTESQLTNIIKRITKQVLHEQVQQQAPAAQGSRNPLWQGLSKILKAMKPSEVKNWGIQMGKGSVVGKEAILWNLAFDGSVLPGYNYGIRVENSESGDVAEIGFEAVNPQLVASISDFFTRAGYSRASVQDWSDNVVEFNLSYFKPEKLAGDLKNLMATIPVKGAAKPTVTAK